MNSVAGPSPRRGSMRRVRLFLGGIAGSLLLLPVVQAEESRPALVAVPSFQGTMPDGTPVIAIVVIPAENVLNKNAAWLAWEQQWPTQYRVSSPAGPAGPKAD